MKIYAKIISLSVLFLIVLSLGILYINTGIFQENSLDDRDLNRWTYHDGIIDNAEEFTLAGNNDTCWLLIHGYVSTPHEMKELALQINGELNDTVKAIRLKGHGEVPSHVMNLTIYDWYNQSETELKDMQRSCKKVNVLGASMGGAIAARLAEEDEINHVYFVNAWLKITRDPYSIFTSEQYLRAFSDFLLYSKKTKLADINDPEGIKNHISYWNMPYPPIARSLDFIDAATSDLNKIKAPILVLHSRNDLVSDPLSAEWLYNRSSSNIKEIKWYNESDHLLLMDYDRKDVIASIISFEKRNS